MLAPFRRLWRRALLRQLDRASAESLRRLAGHRVPGAFRRAARASAAYARILAEQGIDPHRIGSLDEFLRYAPVLDKQSTFERFPIGDLCIPGALRELAGIVTSSGQGGSFAFGLATRSQARRAPGMIDLGLEQAFGVDSRRTLVINCLPMGVKFHSQTVTVADVSVREDMAVALFQRFGPHFDQVVLVTDPLFGKRLLDHGAEAGVRWRDHRVHVVVGEEPFGEHYRRYVEAALGIDPEDPAGGFVGSSMGVGELGLNLFFETRESAGMRRALHRDPALACRFIGDGPRARPVPMLFAYNPLRTFVEVLGPDADGFGELAVSLLDRDAAVPLLRYRTGDIARLLTDEETSALRASTGFASQRPCPLPLIAIAGRDRDLLPDGRSVLGCKDALYADPAIASQLTGALRLEVGDGFTVAHVQLRPGFAPQPSVQAALAGLMPAAGPAISVRCWPFAEFPFGMNLDYERKFVYFAGPGQHAAPAGAPFSAPTSHSPSHGDALPA